MHKGIFLRSNFLRSPPIFLKNKGTSTRVIITQTAYDVAYGRTHTYAWPYPVRRIFKKYVHTAPQTNHHGIMKATLSCAAGCGAAGGGGGTMHRPVPLPTHS